ncbi:MAG: hypothetical protein IJI46_02165 [Erysipelotrichaceae bacterium]|nr:hypothetical protein [Erysipelotrichaceae bacterium]
MEKYLNQMDEFYPLRKLDAGEYKTFKISGMDFDNSAYDCEGLGRISLMKAKMPLGLMKMTSMIINPSEIDMPLLNIDIIEAMGKITLYMEQYDTLLNEKRKEDVFNNINKKYSDLADGENKPKWYDEIRYKSSVNKKVSKKDKDRINEYMDEYFEAYLEQCKDAHVCDNKEKEKLNRKYSYGLINNGGPATDVFLKKWGKEKTQDFFDKVLFG